MSFNIQERASKIVQVYGHWLPTEVCKVNLFGAIEVALEMALADNKAKYDRCYLKMRRLRNNNKDMNKRITAQDAIWNKRMEDETYRLQEIINLLQTELAEQALIISRIGK